MKIIEYLKEDKLSSEAHDLELESMKDPFLYESLEGYDSVDDDHVKRLENLERRILSGRKVDISNILKVTAWVVLSVGIIFGVVYLANNISRLKMFSGSATASVDSTENYSPPGESTLKKGSQKEDTSKVIAPSASPTDTVKDDPGMPRAEAGKPSPEIGMREYYKYLKDNITGIKQSKCGGQGGTVIVSFLISQRGNPHKIKIIKGFCPAVNRMLIQLILSGSRWTYGTVPDSKVTLPINF